MLKMTIMTRMTAIGRIAIVLGLVAIVAVSAIGFVVGTNQSGTEVQAQLFALCQRERETILQKTPLGGGA